MTYHMAEAFHPYYTLSIWEKYVILGTSTSAVPYGEIDLLRI